LFNQNIGPLRYLSSLHTLTFGDNFNKNIEPLQNLSSLRSLHFGNLFNQNIEPLQNLQSRGLIIVFPFNYNPIRTDTNTC
jgi:hypothetical protein